MTPATAWTLLITALVTLGILARPFGLPEYLWAVAGAVALVAFRLIGPGDALAGVGKGTDVYLFLVGMMLLAETAREEGLFDWLAAHATRRARGSAKRLFLFVYAVGTIVTIFLSNDATAVVLTPAVAAAMKTAKVDKPLPYLLVCAFIANAASFVLPISNPANLVIYGAHMPPLLHWLPRFALPSLLSIGATCGALYLTQRKALAQKLAGHGEGHDDGGRGVRVPELTAGGITAAVGIGATAVALLTASAFGVDLGVPTAIAGTLTALVVTLRERRSPAKMLGAVSWGVLPLVAGLFVVVEGLDRVGAIGAVARLLHAAVGRSEVGGAWEAGLAIALGSNLVNNLPAGLIAGGAVQAAHVSDRVASAIAIGVDVGPNLSVTGSLATILWLTALRREGQHVDAWAFLKLGLLIMPPALVLALAATLLSP